MESVVSRGFSLSLNPRNKKSCLLAGGEPHVCTCTARTLGLLSLTTTIRSPKYQTTTCRADEGETREPGRPLSLHILTRFITRIKKWPCDAPADACAPLHYFMLDLVVENWRAPPVVKSARIMKCSASRGAQRTPPPTIVHKSSGWFNHFNRRQAARCSLAATVRSLNCPLCVQKVHCCNYEQSCLLPLTLLFTGWNNCFFALLNEQSSALF